MEPKPIGMRELHDCMLEILAEMDDHACKWDRMPEPKQDRLRKLLDDAHNMIEGARWVGFD